MYGLELDSDVREELEKIRNHLQDKENGGRLIRRLPNGMRDDDLTPEYVLGLVEHLCKSRNGTKKFNDVILSRISGFDVSELRAGTFRFTQGS